MSFLFIFMSGILALLCKEYVKFYKLNEKIVSPHFFMILALSIQVIGLCFETLHLWWYTYDGSGLLALDVISRIFNGCAEVTMSVLIMILSTGWTVTYEDIDWDEDIDIFGPLVALVTIVHIMLAALDYVDVDASHKYHDYAGLQGFFLIACKLIMVIYFAYKMN
jgi:hypothetical protein